MDKKAFIRGFGFGVLFTAMILGISCLLRTSDASVVRRARALGMVYGTGDEALFEKTEPTSRGAASGDNKAENTRKPVESTATPKPTKKKVSDKKQEGGDDSVSTDDIEREIKKMEQQAEAASRQITISEGDWSSDVSRRLEAMDIISDADDFDAYLEKNGYSAKIKAGTYTIPSNASYEQIAKAITG